MTIKRTEEEFNQSHYGRRIPSSSIEFKTETISKQYRYAYIFDVNPLELLICTASSSNVFFITYALDGKPQNNQGDFTTDTYKRWGIAQYFLNSSKNDMCIIENKEFYYNIVDNNHTRYLLSPDRIVVMSNVLGTNPQLILRGSPWSIFIN